ncbi:septum formation initiator family protein [Phycicoccus sp. HDW14]|uniref:FtsB family cell division protein n=1 Tax=Phycicoccus sp. HDW14 TaxID=2714941 RepID=UPI00140D30FE|nr:septum formation initiator family protein [Phycicoccus sp. HDW14]QIM21689.1 septum formation initiator family protein [Phycicoccus sp. HDW14]
MATSRSTGPASRPPRRGSAARPSAASRATASGTAGKVTKGTTARGTGRAATRPTTPSAARSASAAPRPSTTSTTTAKVVRRAPSGWRGRVGGAASNRVLRRGVVLAAIGVFITVLLASSVAAWVHQRGQIAALREKVASQEADVAGLRAERERWNDPAYVEQQARQRLKFVRPGERSYTVLDPQPASPDTPTIAGPGADEPASTLPWYSTVWQSVRTADAPGAQR